ncbi:MAG: hypothetical protein JHD02_00340 [Thermoleophilaceae bacterium]|nr:hypothetical protein [Thermoleophilaceae bacterium]
MTDPQALDQLLTGGNVLQILGSPTAIENGTPVTRAATLDDVEDDCPICQQMRAQILAGNAPTVMVFEEA